jgi:DeoR/GlpR family transcriptional regulator of sugar metabolism
MSEDKEKSLPVNTTMNGLQTNETMPRGLYISTKKLGQPANKREIAIHVADKYVKDFDAVLLDAGSTAEMIAEEMFTRRKYLSVLTNNMGAYAAYTRARWGSLRETNSEGPPPPSNELLITGGRYDDMYESLFGERAIDSIVAFIPNVIIIGTSGIRCGEGIFCHGTEDSAVKQLLWTKPTDIRLIAADWTKIGRRDAHSFGTVEQLRLNAKRAIVVTSELPRAINDEDPERAQEFENQIRMMKKHHIEVEMVKIPKDENKCEENEKQTRGADS